MGQWILEPTLGATFLKRTEVSAEKTLYVTHYPDKLEKLTFAQVHYEAHYLCIGLHRIGVKPQDRLVVIADPNARSLELDFAMLGAQAVSCHLSKRIQEPALRFILRELQPRAIFVDSVAMCDALHRLRAQDPDSFAHVTAIVLLQSEAHHPADRWNDSAVVTLQALKEFGIENEGELKNLFERGLRQAQPDEIFTICYTTGTTGTPKGVPLSHSNLISILDDAYKIFSPYWRCEEECAVSTMDLSHGLSRVEQFAGIAFGWTRSFAPTHEKTFGMLSQLDPTILFTSPSRLIKKYIDDTAAASTASGGRLSAIFDAVTKNRKPLLASSLRYILTSEAPLPAALLEYFAQSGMMILEGYGLTETAGPVSLNSPKDYRPGTAGRPFPEVSIKTAPDGEILIRSKKVFSGYYHRADETAQVLRDGWLHTGDVGFIDPDGYLHVTGRKQDVFTLKNGQKVNPLQIEKRAGSSLYLEEIMVWGENQPHVSALVTVKREPLLQYAAQENLLYTEEEDLYRHPKTLLLVQKEIDRINQQLPEAVAIRKFAIVPPPLRKADGVTGRQEISARFQDVLARLSEPKP